MQLFNLIYIAPILLLALSLTKGFIPLFFLLIETLAFPFFFGWHCLQRLKLPSFFELKNNPQNKISRLISSLSAALILVFTYIYLLVVVKHVRATGQWTDLLNTNIAPIRYAFFIIVLLAIIFVINRYAKPDTANSSRLINLRVYLKNIIQR